MDTVLDAPIAPFVVEPSKKGRPSRQRESPLDSTFLPAFVIRYLFLLAFQPAYFSVICSTLAPSLNKKNVPEGTTRLVCSEKIRMFEIGQVARLPYAAAAGRGSAGNVFPATVFATAGGARGPSTDNPPGLDATTPS